MWRVIFGCIVGWGRKWGGEGKVVLKRALSSGCYVDEWVLIYFIDIFYLKGEGVGVFIYELCYYLRVVVRNIKFLGFLVFFVFWIVFKVRKIFIGSVRCL